MFKWIKDKFTKKDEKLSNDKIDDKLEELELEETQEIEELQEEIEEKIE